MKKVVRIFNFILVISLFVSCNSSENDINSLETKRNNQVIFDFYKTQSQKFTLPPNSTETFIGNQGTKITISSNSLETMDGKSVSGAIDFELQEYYKSSDIILANLSTTSNNKLLETGGMIHISAKSKGKELKVKEGENFEIEFSSPYEKEMQVFYGKFENEKMNWKPDSKSANIELSSNFHPASPTLLLLQEDASNYTRSDSIASYYNNLLYSSNLGWINCDRFREMENLTEMTLEYNQKFKPSAFLVFENYNSIMSCRHSEKSREFVNLPINESVTLITFSINEDKPFYFSEKILVQEGQKINLDLKEIQLEELRVEIENSLK